MPGAPMSRDCSEEEQLAKMYEKQQQGGRWKQGEEAPPSSPQAHAQHTVALHPRLLRTHVSLVNRGTGFSEAGAEFEHAAE